MSKSINKSLGEIIKEDLKEKGLNQSAVARKMNVSKQVINQIDRRKDFDMDFLLRFKEATGLDYTTYLYRPQTEPLLESPPFNRIQKADPVVEMSLYIKLKSDPSLLNRMGDLLLTIRKEAVKMGFTVI